MILGGGFEDGVFYGCRDARYKENAKMRADVMEIPDWGKRQEGQYDNKRTGEACAGENKAAC